MGIAAAEVVITSGSAESALKTPVAWMFAAILVTFVIARLVTRYIRHRSDRPQAEDSRGPIVGDISLGGIHIHHQVFGILIMLVAGLTLVTATPEGTALSATSAVFGVGVGLVFDEFALWLHLKDVYWANEGRQSIDAMFCVLAITGMLIGGANIVSGRIGSGSWWLSIAGLAITLGFSLVCTLKGKLVTGVIGVLLSPVAIIGAIRLGKPQSWWARRRYARHPRRMARAEHRFGSRYQQRWNRVRDFIAGAPTGLAAFVEPPFVQPELPLPPAAIKGDGRAPARSRPPAP
jgi:hypothetical protein